MADRASIIAAAQAVLAEVQALPPDAPPPPPPGGGVLATLASNTLRNCGTYLDTEQTDWLVKSRNIGDDSGTVADHIGRQVIALGGAHGPMQASNPRAFSTETGKWRNMHLSTRWADMIAANADQVKGRWLDTNSPIARHTYSMLVVAQRRLYVMAAYQNPDNLPGGSLPFVHGKISWMDLDGPNANKWTFGNCGTPWYYANGACADPLDPDSIYVVGMTGTLAPGKIWRYNIPTDSGTTGPVLGISTQPIDLQYCPDDDRFYAFENVGAVRRITVNRANFSASTGQLLTTTGPKPPGPGRPFGYPCCSWVPHRKRFGGWFNAGKYREFDPVSLVWTETTMLMEAGSSGSNVGAIFSCASFEEWSGCFVFLDTENVQKTWAYRP